MGFTLVAFSEPVAVAGVIGEIAAVPDQTHRSSLDDLYIGKFNRLVGESSEGGTVGDAYLTSPSLRRVSRKYIAPLLSHTSDARMGVTWNWHGHSPLELDVSEQLNAFMSETIVSGTWNSTIGVWLADGIITVVNGPIHTIHASVSGTFNEKEWGNAPMTLTPDLPMGRYQIVGARCYMVGGGLFRFNFIGEWFRPGGMCISEYSLSTMPWQRNGGMGVWGEFDTLLPPTIDLLPLKVAGETEAYLRIDIIKVR